MGGWFDAEDVYGPLAVYRAVERTSPAATNVLVMGPWTHGSWSRGDGDRVGNLTFGSRTGAFYREHIELPFFLQHLKGKAATVPEAQVFHTGINGGSHEACPPPAAAEGSPLAAAPELGKSAGAGGGRYGSIPPGPSLPGTSRPVAREV